MIISAIILIAVLGYILWVGFVIQAILHKTSLNFSGESIDTPYFAGFCFLSVIVSYGSLVIAIDNYLLLVFLIALIFLSLFHRKRIADNLKRSVEKSNLKAVYGVLFFVLVLVLLLLRSNENFIYDTGLYHTQNIMWIKEYPVVPGLGNLHGRFAFNSLFFVLQGMFSFEVFTDDNQSILLYPLNMVTFLVLVFTLFRSIKQEIIAKNWRKALASIFVCFFAFRLIKLGVNSPNTDIISAILIVYVFQTLIKSRLEVSKFKVVLIATLTFVIISYKISSIFICILLIPLILKPEWKVNLGLICITGLIVLSPFFIRNYYLSGYLVYPVAQVDLFDPEWKVPIEKVEREACWVKSWSLIPYKPCEEVNNLPVSEWIDEWLKRKKFEVFVLLGSALVLLFGFVYYLKEKNLLMITVSFSILSTFIFWLFSAPDPRFIIGFLIVSTGIVLPEIFLFLSRLKLFAFIFKNKTGLTILSLGLLLVVVSAHKSKIELIANQTSLLWLPAAQPPVEVERNETNFVYYSPKDGDKCSYYPIPCTPYPNPLLKLRKEELKDGFMISENN